MPTVMVELKIRTVFPGEVAEALHRHAVNLRLSAKQIKSQDRFTAMSHEVRADEMDRVARQILESE